MVRSGWGKPRSAGLPWPDLPPYQMADGLGPLPFTLGSKHLSFPTPPKYFLKNIVQLGFQKESQSFASWNLHAAVQIGTRFKTPDV